MPSKRKDVWVITFYDYKGNKLFSGDTSEVAIGAASAYDFNLLDIKKNTGKWPTKIKFEFIERIN